MATRVILRCKQEALCLRDRGTSSVHTEIDGVETDGCHCGDTISALAEAFRRMTQLGTTELVCFGADAAANTLESVELEAGERRD